MDEFQQASGAEMEIMHIIWKLGGKTPLAPLMKQLQDNGKSWKTSTIVTFLSRMADKGLLSVQKGERGNTNIYTAVFSETEFRKRQTDTFISKLYGGSAKELVASLIKENSLTNDDIAEISEFWKKGGENE